MYQQGTKHLSPANTLAGKIFIEKFRQYSSCGKGKTPEYLYMYRSAWYGMV